MEKAHRSHAGILRALRDPDNSIRADLTVGEGALSIRTNGQLLGTWPLSEVQVEFLPVGAFHLVIEGESWFFTADRPGQLAGAIDLARTRMRTPDDTKAATTPPPQRDVQRLDLPIALVLSAGSMFFIGILVGRHGAGVFAVPTLYVLALVTAAGAAWAYLRTTWGTRESPAGTADRGPVRLQLPATNAIPPTRAIRAEPAAPPAPEAGLDLETARASLVVEGSDAAPDGSTDEEVEETIGESTTVTSEPQREEGPPPPGDLPEERTDDDALEVLVEVERAINEPAEPAPEGESVALQPSGSFATPPGSLNSSGYQRVLDLLRDEKQAQDGGSDIDDLEQIAGIGPVFAYALRSLGYSTFADVASLDDNAIDRIEDLVGAVRWRLDRYAWRDSAAALHTEKYGVPIETHTFGN